MTSAPAPTGSLDVALAQANRLLAQDPELARAQTEEILKVMPRQPAAWMLLGLALGRLGRGDDALTALRRSVALQPSQPQAWRAIGDHLSAIGDAVGADTAYAQHVRHSVRDPNLLAAAAALQENRLPEAESALKKHLHAQPTDVAAIRMLAELAIRIGRNTDAEHLLERCLELAPSFREARQNYALLLHRENKPEQALAELETLLANDPGNPSHRTLKAAILCRLGDYDAGIVLYEQILREYPNNPRVWLSHGHALKTAGQQAAAIAAYRHCCVLDPGFGEAYWSLANLKTYRFNAEEVAAMRQQLLRSDLGAEHRLQFDFALGKALEDAGNYAESFQHYLDGNRLRLALVPYNARDNHMRVVAAMRTYTREFFQQRADWGEPAADPIFIVGLPRAGSTLLEQILSSHPQVEGTMELPEIISLTRELRVRAGAGTKVSYHEILAELKAEDIRALGRDYLDRTRIQRKAGTAFFIDKMPNNFLHAGLIRLALPNAKIIDARRHPLACCVSGFKQHFARGQNFTYSLSDIGRFYRDYVELMAHFDTVQPGWMHRVFHENMVDDSDAEIRRLLDYCGLPFDAACLRFFENERPVRTASSEQVRRPINRDGVDQWRHYESWLEPLKIALGPVLECYPEVPSFEIRQTGPESNTTSGE